MPVLRYDSGKADLEHTNMCYRCDYCDQGYNRIIYLEQVGMEYYMCDNCRDYYKVSYSDARKLQFVETREDWVDAIGIWVPMPLGFADHD